MTIERTPLLERFWKYVTKTDTCWLWTGKGRQHFGYGVINSGGKNGKIERAHRVSWAIHKGPIPDNLCVCHHCDNPLCVNPDHLFLGTRTDNNRDMNRKGRYDRTKRPKGERHGMSKLTPEKVRAIIAEREGGKLLREIASRYGISPQQVHRISKKKSWKHL
jgi:hypothetical protein